MAGGGCGRLEGQYTCDFGEAGVHALQHIFLQNVSASLMKLLLIMRSSCHHEGFWCFSRYGEIQKFGS